MLLNRIKTCILVFCPVSLSIQGGCRSGEPNELGVSADLTHSINWGNLKGKQDTSVLFVLSKSF